MFRTKEYLQSLVRELSKLPAETEWVEFKCNNNNPQEIGEYISAISNSAKLFERPYGYLIWGINDSNHLLCGTDFRYRKARKGNEELEAWLARLCNPRINFRFFEVEMDGFIIVVLEIPCADRQPTNFAGEEYIRIGSNKKKLKDYPDKERALWVLFESKPFELKTAASNLTDEQVISLLDYPKYYDLMEAPIPGNREDIFKDFENEKFIRKDISGKWEITNLY